MTEAMKESTKASEEMSPAMERISTLGWVLVIEVEVASRRVAFRSVIAILVQPAAAKAFAMPAPIPGSVS